MIYAWLTARKLGLAKGWWVLIALAGLIAGYLWLTAREQADDQRNQNIGAAVQREGDLRETINRKEKADEARDSIRASDRARYDQCLRTARTPANCERFLPRGKADQR